MAGKRVIVAGANGYLANSLIRRLGDDPEVENIVAMDIRLDLPLKILLANSHLFRKLTFVHCDVRDRAKLDEIFKEGKFTVVYHLIWVFDPTHDFQFEYDVDVEGTKNILDIAKKYEVETIVYVGSTTAYINKNNTEDPIKETDEEKVIGTPDYWYSYLKAMVDKFYRSRMNDFSSAILIRGSIVLGPHTKNIVSQMASLPVMPRVAGYDPLMQFCSEYDMTEVLYQSLNKKGHWVVNVTGDGTLRYSEIAKVLGKKCLPLPAWLLYPLLGLVWRLQALSGFKWLSKLLPFPPGILDLISCHWLGDNNCLKNDFGYTPKHNSIEALMHFKNRNKQIK